MSTHYERIQAVVIDKIRSTVNEDWIEDFEIGPQTRFNDDLELESVEFVKIADALQAHYGARLDIIAWLSGKSIQQLIGLSVGDLTGFIAGSVAASEA